MGGGASYAIELRAYFMKALTWSHFGENVVAAILFYLCVSLSLFLLCRLARVARLEPRGRFCSAATSELVELLFDYFGFFSF